ncbi:hypothetical protein PoB_001274300 [Plakobranchus ocellatus]|uniref:Uncharacterized protein n=1 Tax=Plakobranchus ocellatus TaxID=259542 RepID=A0AAV3YUK0_9GAST|nr:hypothetical protein PoB_001274300 [Plakobranchus ocellatus]
MVRESDLSSAETFCRGFESRHRRWSGEGPLLLCRLIYKNSKKKSGERALLPVASSGLDSHPGAEGERRKSHTHAATRRSPSLRRITRFVTLGSARYRTAGDYTLATRTGERETKCRRTGDSRPELL